MKKLLYFALASMMLMGCSETSEQEELSDELIEVKVGFSGFTFYDEPMTTRAGLADAATHIDIWVTDGTTTQDIHQVSTDTGFGTAAFTLSKQKTYTLYAVAHKCAGAATLANGIISFPDDIVKETFYYTTTFTPSETTSLSATMKRIVGRFQLVTTDKVPSNVDHMKFVISKTGTRWNVSTNAATNIIDREVTFATISTKDDGTASFSTSILSTTDTPSTFDITVTAYDAQDAVVGTHTFNGLQIQNNHKTVCTGSFFEGTTSSVFTVENWLEDILIAF